MARSPDHRGILLAISMVVVVLVVILLIPRFEESGTRLPPPDRQIENNFKQVAIDQTTDSRDSRRSTW